MRALLFAEPPETPAPAESFTFFGPSHLLGLAAIALLAVVLVTWSRRRDPADPGLRRLQRGLSLLLAANVVVWQIRLIALQTWSLADSLPLHLCDAGQICAIWALWNPGRLQVQLLYYWGLAGAIPALMTPDFNEPFPHYDYWQFFVTHGGMVVAALWLAFGSRWTPAEGAPLRMMLWTNAFAVPAAVADLLFDANYMYLAAPPEGGSLLDHLGPWPWYLLSAQVLAFLLFVLLDQPFRGRRAELSPQAPGDRAENDLSARSPSRSSDR